MRQAILSLAMSLRATLVFFIALVVGAIALLSLVTKPAESQQAPAQPLYEIHDLGTLGGSSYSIALDINGAGNVVGGSLADGDTKYRAFLYSNGTMQDLGILGGLGLAGAGGSQANAINNTDHVAGWANTQDTPVVQHAFLHSSGQMNDLGTLGGSSSWANSINDTDKVVGSSYISGDAAEHAFLYSDGQMKDLGTLAGSSGTLGGFTGSGASDINNTDEVVGNSTLSDCCELHAFLYEGGVMKDLNSLIPAGSGWNLGDATAINDNGYIVGRGDIAGEGHAYLYNNGVIKDLGTLGSDHFSSASDINNTGQVVGVSEYMMFDGSQHAFLYSDGVMRDLNSLIPADSGWTLREATAINDNGYIVGVGINKDGQEHAFLLTPIPYFDGFYQPVDNLPTLNKTKPGKTIPVRFSLGGDKGLDIFADGYPKSEAISCDSTAPVDGIEETITGKGGLSYNASIDRYQYDWATSSSWSGCRQFVMKLKDGTVHRANFIFR